MYIFSSSSSPTSPSLCLWSVHTFLFSGQYLLLVTAHTFQRRATRPKFFQLCNFNAHFHLPSYFGYSVCLHGGSLALNGVVVHLGKTHLHSLGQGCPCTQEP